LAVMMMTIDEGVC